MLIPIGARIDRKTGEMTELYREGTQNEFLETFGCLIRFGLSEMRKDALKAHDYGEAEYLERLEKLYEPKYPDSHGQP